MHSIHDQMNEFALSASLPIAIDRSKNLQLRDHVTYACMQLASYSYCHSGQNANSLGRRKVNCVKSNNMNQTIVVISLYVTKLVV